MNNYTQNMYKGYMELISGTKMPNAKITDKENYITYSRAKHKDSFCGVLKDSIVMVDVDNIEYAEKIKNIILQEHINCNIIKTTNGMHFYFNNTNLEKNRSARTTILPIGIDETDIKLGKNNTVDPLKLEGISREWLLENETIDSLPSWLYPIPKKDFINFSALSEGDGRNQTLFNYIITLQQIGISKEEIKNVIRIINKYILKDPLPEKEIDTILRDEAFLKESFYIKGKLQYESLAKYLRDNEYIIKINDNLHIYQDGVYTNDLNSIEKILLKYINNSTKTPRAEIIRYLELLTDNKQLASAKYVLFDNGIFDLENKTLAEFNPKVILKNKIPVSYNPDAYSEVVDKTLNKICCNDKQLRTLIEEMIGYCLFRRNELGKCFILTGSGANGKSTLLDVLITLLGDNNISSVALDELNERFKTYQLEGKLANVGDDISNKYIDDNSTFKKLVTGEKVNVERKGKDPFDMNNYSKLIFSANELPRINDLSDALKRRLLFIPFNAKFSKHDKDFDPWIKDKLCSSESLEYFLKIALQGLYRILENKEFTYCEACEEIWKEYEQINNPVVAFLNENDINNQPCEDVYKHYQLWCVEGGLKAFSKNSFGREVKKHGYNSDRIYQNGKQVRMYIKE